MSQELELQELQELIEELDEKHTMESSRQDHTTWVMQDLIKIMKKITKDKSLHDKLAIVWDKILKNC